jgi:hypothetical protein
LWWLWVIGTAALLVMAALAFVSSLNSSSIDSGDQMARAAILLASAALIFVGGRAARRVITGD